METVSCQVCLSVAVLRAAVVDLFSATPHTGASWVAVSWFWYDHSSCRCNTDAPVPNPAVCDCCSLLTVGLPVARLSQQRGVPHVTVLSQLAGTGYKAGSYK